MTDEQFKQASDFLREVHKNVRLYWTDKTDIVQAMSSGEVDLAWAWNDAACSRRSPARRSRARATRPKASPPGSAAMSMLKDAPGSADKAYDFLNAVNDPEVANYIVKDWGYGHANGKGMAGIDPTVLEEKGYADVEKFVDKTLFQSPVPAELKLKMIAEFEKIKAGF